MNCLRPNLCVAGQRCITFIVDRVIGRRVCTGFSILLAMVFAGSAAHATYPVNDAAANAALSILNGAVAKDVTLTQVVAQATAAVGQLTTINTAMLTTGAPIGLNAISAVTPIVPPILGACPNPVALLIHPNTLLQIAECNLMTATVTQLFTLTNAFIVEQNLYSTKLQTLAAIPSATQGVVLQTSLQVQILIASQQNRFNSHIAQVEGLKSKIRQHEREIKRLSAGKIGG